MNLLLAAVLLLQDKTAEEAFQKIGETIEKAKTLSVRIKVELTASVGGQPAKAESSGTLLLKDPNKANLHLTGKFSAAGQEREMVTRFVTDGQKIEAENLGEKTSPAKNIKGGFKPLLSRSGVAFGISPVLSQSYGPDRKPIASDLDLLKAFELSDFKKGSDDAGTKTLAYVLKMRVFEDEQRHCNVKLWYDPKTWKILKRTFDVTLGPDKGTHLTETYEEMALEVDIPDEKFRLPAEK
ncbi:MAG: hypothetical protein HY293_00575 [Planctomycetes bacterium]|nr:hypothetical protein [Planctomycetota bacterium]